MQAVSLYKFPRFVLRFKGHFCLASAFTHWTEVLAHDTLLVRLLYINTLPISPHKSVLLRYYHLYRQIYAEMKKRRHIANIAV